MADRVGQQLGNYHLLRLLGEGGFAEVYLGEHIHLGTQAAIKVLHTQLTNDDVERFRTEARTIARLIHPHIVRVLDFGIESKTPFLVMDYAPNGTLRQRHPRGVALPLPLIIGYVKQVADALQYAHNEKLIHRDIKPENMLLGRRNELLLSDFGIALVAQSSRYQSAQEMAGTMAYMAPEQIQGKPRPASDQYSLGIVAYEWISGDRPFHGSLPELVGQHLSAPPSSLQEKISTISPEVDRVVLTALAKDPHQRFANVQAFATALEQACQLAPSHPVAFPVNFPLPIKPILSSDGVPAITQSQSSFPTNLVTSPSRKLQSTIEATPFHTPDMLPSSRRESISAGKPRSSQHRISRRAVAISLAGLAVVGSGLGWLVHSLQPAQLVLGPGATPTTGSTTITGHTVTPTATPSSTPIPIGTTLYTYRGHSDYVYSVQWSPNDQRIVSASEDKTVQVWDAADGGNTYIYRGHGDRANRAVWSPNGRHIASASSDTTVQVWDATTGANVYVYRGHTAPVSKAAWSPDSRRIASCGGDRTVQVWNEIDGGNVYIYRGHTAAAVEAAWSLPDGKRIASASEDRTVQVWDATDGSNVYIYRGHTGAVFSIAWSHNGKFLASGGDRSDAIVQVWDAK